MGGIDPPESVAAPPTPKPEEPRRHLQIMVLALIAVVSFFTVLNVVTESESLSIRAVGTRWVKGGGGGVFDGTGKADTICSAVCTERASSARYADLLDYGELIGRVEVAQTKLLDKLRADYGEYFEPIFVDPDTGRYRPVVPLTDDGVSVDRLRRKLQIKILSMQSNVRAADSDVRGCDCSVGGTAQAVRPDEVLAMAEDGVVEDDADADDTGLFEKYVWVTGGHSASAGHGNLYNETYTSYMEADLVEVFGSIGIEFEGRNYAMGGTASGTLVSMCWKEIFGDDADFFSWDYGMVDGNLVAKLLHYAYRGALSINRPGMMMLHYNGRIGEKRLQAMRDLQDMGLATFLADDNAQKIMKEAFPDSAGIDSASIDALPEYVRNYKCGVGIEKGDPYCTRDKFTKWGCSPRYKQTSWHPGYKDHARVGHGLALFWTETLLDALRDLSENEEAKDASGLLSRLAQEDIDLHNNFTAANLPDLHNNLLKLDGVEMEDGETGIDNALFFRGPSMCHTARVPSQTRYHGVLIATNQIGGPAPVGMEEYYVGDSIESAKTTATLDSELRLVYTTYRERETKCQSVVVKPDYPDSWFANALDGWAKVVFPNDAEKEYFGYDDPKEYRGIIFLHWKPCDWGKCPKGFLTPEDFANNGWEMKVNSQKVAEVIDVNQGATIIKGEETGFVFEPGSNGQYTIEIKVNTENSYVEIADFVVY